MARATKERLERDAARFGLVANSVMRAYVSSLLDEAECVCGRLIGKHSRAQLFECKHKQLAERRGRK